MAAHQLLEHRSSESAALTARRAMEAPCGGPLELVQRGVSASSRRNPVIELQADQPKAATQHVIGLAAQQIWLEPALSRLGVPASRSPGAICGNRRSVDAGP